MSKISVGIVGLPNVGKSTLFQILTQQSVAIANYPFCTIDPNVGVVAVPDERLDQLAVMSKSAKVVPAVIEFYDIAGLVKGANQGEGLGNQFLSHIRDVNAIVMVLRCFESSDIIHVENSVDPVRDLEIINTELILKDLESVDKRLDKARAEARGENKTGIKNQELRIMEKVKERLNKNELITDLADEPAVKNLNLLTAKQQLYLLNGSSNDASPKLIEKIKTLGGAHVIADLAETQRTNNSEALTSLITEAYRILDLISFFTTGEEESRAWTIRRGMLAPQAAGVIHTDFEKKFIRAEIVSWKDLLDAGSWVAAKQKGLVRLEGKQYAVKEGDVLIVKHG